MGEIMLGFSILMSGIHQITQAVNPLKQNETFISLLTSLDNPILLFCSGIAIAAILQSASAAVGIVQTLSLSGFIAFHTAFPVLLGIGIGASVPVIISAAGRTADAKRCAFIYLLINVSAAAIFGVMTMILSAIGITLYDKLLLNPVSVSLINTVYRLAVVLLWLPFCEYLVGISRGIIKSKKHPFIKKQFHPNE